jgi:hypothetical protein
MASPEGKWARRRDWGVGRRVARDKVCYICKTEEAGCGAVDARRFGNPLEIREKATILDEPTSRFATYLTSRIFLIANPLASC